MKVSFTSLPMNMKPICNRERMPAPYLF